MIVIVIIVLVIIIIIIIVIATIVIILSSLFDGLQGVPDVGPGQLHDVAEASCT